MNDNFDEILVGLPEKRSRSRLEPYGELIGELLRRRRTYREIASILVERCHVRASISTIHDFVRVRAAAVRKARRCAEYCQKSGRDRHSRDNGIPTDSRTPQEAADEVRQRIAALKLQQAPAQTQERQFEYDPSEPLRVPQKPGSGKK